jgi:hypothetical protein
MRTMLASLLVVVLAACSGPAKKPAAGPGPDDLPSEVTCCITPGEDEQPDTREVVAVESCPEEKRNAVDQCNVGPGENEPSM